MLEILQKRRTDLTDDDVRVMYDVVDTVAEQTEVENGSPRPRKRAAGIS
ncbi:hypothetical protein SALBM311S_01425 [Streptomyces alboniger]